MKNNLYFYAYNCDAVKVKAGREFVRIGLILRIEIKSLLYNMSDELKLNWEFPGTLPYEQAHARMLEIHANVSLGVVPDTILVLNHPPVYTSGRRFNSDQVLAGFSEDENGNRWIDRIPLVQIERGGLLTYHDTGQIILYPVLRVPPRKTQFRRLVCMLEKAAVHFCSGFGVKTFLQEGQPGVFSDKGKIASLGLAIQKGVTLHGLAINLHTDKSNFARIAACGVADQAIANVYDYTGPKGAAIDHADRLQESFICKYLEWLEEGKNSSC